MLLLATPFYRYTRAVDSDDPASRGELDFVLLLTVVTFKFLIADDLPNIEHVSFLDKYMYFTIAMFAAVIIENALVSFVVDEDERNYIDKWFYACYLFVWTLTFVWFGYHYVRYHRGRHLEPNKPPEIRRFQQKFKEQGQSKEKSYDLCIHMDLNKTIMAVDSVKNYSLKEVVLLEHYKRDAAFLKWAYEFKKYGGEAEGDFESFSSKFQQTESEPDLIKLAEQFDSQNGGAAEKILQGLDQKGVVRSFWKLLKWCQKQSDLKILLCFRTFGTELQMIGDMLEENGEFSSCLIKDEDSGKMKRWTMLHEYPSTLTDRKNPAAHKPSDSPGTPDDYVKMEGGRYKYGP
jgi:hypothetical protein